MAFNASQAWVTRLEPKFLEEEMVAYTQSYTYYGITHRATIPNFLLLMDMQPLVPVKDNVHMNLL